MQQSAKKHQTTATGKTRKPCEVDQMQERIIPQQTTQFNNRLVSSTPDMGSPNSSHHPDDDPGVIRVNTIIPPTTHHQDPSLEALAAQIRMLRSQAELAESSPDPIHPARVHEPSRLNTSVVKQEKVDLVGEPRMLLMNLNNHLRDLNNRQQQNAHSQATLPNEDTRYNQQQTFPRNLFTHHNLQRPPEADSHIPTNNHHQIASAPLPTTGEHTWHVSCEPPTSTNVSFIGEYRQLPDQNMDVMIPNRETHFDQMTAQISSMPAPQHHNPPPSFSGQKKTGIPQGCIFHVDTSNTPNHMPIHSDQNGVAHSLCTKEQMHTSPQVTTPQRTNHHLEDSHRSFHDAGKQQDIKSSKNNHGEMHAVSMGTQTSSPPADKGVQTSNPSSPSSNSDVDPSSHTDVSDSPHVSSDNAQHQGCVSNHHDVVVIDTPCPQLTCSSRKKSASWEQMRVLKYLVGELASAICIAGE